MADEAICCETQVREELNEELVPVREDRTEKEKEMGTLAWQEEQEVVMTLA